MNELRGLWRGKRVDNGEWVEGYLIKMWGQFCLQNKEDENLVVEVDPSTLGECTGLRDKNGKLIFEGDIVNCSSGCPHEVIYVKEYGGTYLGGMPAFYLSGLREGYAWTGSEELIGNIHDTPELLKTTGEDI